MCSTSWEACRFIRDYFHFLLGISFSSSESGSIHFVLTSFLTSQTRVECSCTFPNNVMRRPPDEYIYIYIYIYIYLCIYIYTCTVFTQRRSTLILALCNASSGKLAQVRCLFLARLPSLPEKIILQHSGCSSSELKDSRVAPLKHSRRLSSEFRDFCIAPIMLHAEIL